MPENNISCLARAKINLDLLVCGRRDDGYHLLDSLVVFADYGDRVSARPSDKLSLGITGPFAGDLIGEQDNSILKAAKLLQNRCDIRAGAEINLVKALPVSSGIGGGSADAAATLRALGELWNISGKSLGNDDLAKSLGADLPVCMASETTQMTGTGEKLRPVTIDFPLYMLLVNPDVTVSTKEIFRARAQRNAPFSSSRILPDHITSLHQLRDILASSGNDLQFDACRAVPEISNALAEVSRADPCVYAALCGSGATCFGLFLDKAMADRAARNITRNFPRWWGQSVRIC